MSNEFNVCPICKSQNIKYLKNKKWFCSDCGFDLYNNVAAAVGCIIYDNDNNVLFEIRKKDPRKGYLGLPGGFVDMDERAEDAVVRECLEEIGFKIGDAKFLCTFPNTYEYKNIQYKTCDMFFCYKLENNYKTINDLLKNLTAQQSEVKGFSVQKIETENDVENMPLAFESAKHSLQMWVKNR